MGLWFAPLLALGVARVVAGTANGRPVGFLVLFLLVTVAVAAALALRAPDATEQGRRTLERRLRAEHPRPRRGASPAELSMGTALFGAGALWAADIDIATMLRVPREHGTFAGGGGGGGDGGAGGGGGGGGGGGCGGGGGGCGG
jgi:uncharacterized membrane protein YgcG